MEPSDGAVLLLADADADADADAEDDDVATAAVDVAVELASGCTDVAGLSSFATACSATGRRVSCDGVTRAGVGSRRA
jgi:hypothetical protein